MLNDFTDLILVEEKTIRHFAHQIHFWLEEDGYEQEADLNIAKHTHILEWKGKYCFIFHLC